MGAKNNTITTLIENNPDDANFLKAEHGLSMLITFEGKQILFDTGQTGAFIDNAKQQEVSLDNLDALVLSHGHYDHTGGVKRLLQEGKQPPLCYVGKGFFQKKYKKLPDGSYHYNGNAFTREDLLQAGMQTVCIQEEMVALTKDILLFHQFTSRMSYEKQNPQFYIETKEGKDYELDSFQDEIALGLVTKKGLVVCVGCAHVGIVNLLRTIKERTAYPIYGVIGGTHLVEADEERMQGTIRDLGEMGIGFVAVSHCTGEVGIHRMQQAFTSRFQYNNTGNVIYITGLGVKSLYTLLQR